MSAEQLELPNDLGVDVRGLSTQRARLARLVAWRKREEDHLRRLEAGRSRLDGRIARAEESARLEDAEIDSAAAGVVEQIRKSLDFTFSPFRKRTAEPIPDLVVERRAREKVNAAIEQKRCELEAIGKRVEAAADVALEEHAAETIGAAYIEAIEGVRVLFTRLEGLDVALGRGRNSRLTGDLPGFRTSGHELATAPVAAAQRDVGDAAACWQELRRVWSLDPRSDPAS